MITKEQAVELEYGCVVYYRYRDGPIESWRVNGKVQTWKTRPDDFRVPLSAGMHRRGSEITESNSKYFYLSEEDAKTDEERQVEQDVIKARYDLFIDLCFAVCDQLSGSLNRVVEVAGVKWRYSNCMIEGCLHLDGNKAWRLSLTFTKAGRYTVTVEQYSRTCTIPPVYDYYNYLRTYANVKHLFKQVSNIVNECANNLTGV